VKNNSFLTRLNWPAAMGEFSDAALSVGLKSWFANNFINRKIFAKATERNALKNAA